MTLRFYETPISKSFGLHILLLLLAFIYITQFSKPFSPEAPIEMTFVDKKEDVVQPKPQEKDDKSKTVVQRSEGKEVDVAKKDSYLSDKTRTVEEEKAARRAGEIQVVPGQASNKPQQTAHKAAPKQVTLSDLGMKLTPKADKQFSEDHTWADSQTGQAVQGGQYIKGMKEGEVSALNTKEYIFFSYFDRVRRQLDQAWQPILRENIEHIFKVGRKLASNSEYTTRTLVTLNARGEIVKVQLLEESGTHDLDQAAVDALNKAGPYPNPPKGLIDSSGLVEIRWDFILKT